MAHVFIASLIMATALVLVPQATCHAQTEGRWAGTVQFQHASWPIRVDINSQGDDVVLAFPELGMSLIPSPSVLRDDGIEVELPFGLGKHRLIHADGGMRSEAEATPTRIYVELRPDAVPAPVEQVVKFESGGTELVGTLYLPGDAAGRHAGLVVCGHGAEPFHRRTPEYRFWAEHLTRLGFAAFLYDKRGTGESGGTHDGAALEELTHDLSNAARACMEHAAVPPQRTALLGGSQFGWLAFRAALDQNIGVIVLSAAPAVDPITLESRVLYEVYTSNGIGGNDLADAMAFTRAYFSAARNSELIPHIQAMAAKHATSPWIGMAPVPSGPEDLAWWAENGVYDPATDIRQFEGSVFAVYGELDRIAPPDLNALRLEQLVRSNGGEVTTWIAEGANHRLEVPGGVIGGSFRFPRLAPDYLSHIESFLREHLKADQETHPPPNDPAVADERIR